MVIKEMAAAYLHEKVANIIVKRFDKKIRILELGSGQGAFANRLFDMGFKDIVCVDINKENFKLDNKVEFLKCDLNTDFSEKISERFDLVVSLEVIEHVENPWHFFREVKKTLSENGKFIFSTPNIDTIKSKLTFLKKGRFSFFYHGDYEDSGHITPLPKFILYYLIEKNNFKKKVYTQNVKYNYNFKKISHIFKFIMHYIIGIFFVKEPDFGQIHIFLLEK